jgi:hypothetical protein
MAEGAWLIMAFAVLIVFSVIAIIYAIDTWPRKVVRDEPDEVEVPETVEVRYRKAGGE